jgi:hypothetical protein
MTTQLKFVLDLQSDKQASLQLKASFEARMRFANGIRVKDPATPIAGK